MDANDVSTGKLIKFENVKEEPDDNIVECPWNAIGICEPNLLLCSVKEENDTEEELETPVAVFLKNEEVTQADEEEFERKEETQDDEAIQPSQDEEEEELQPPAAVFLEPFVNTEDDCKGKKDPLGPRIFSNSDSQESDGDLAEIFKLQTPLGLPAVDLVCVCGMRFCTEEQAAAHSSTHSEAKPFRCPICNKFFSVEQHAVFHIQTHPGLRYHECTVCKKIFAQRGLLVSHMITHTGKSPYQCDICKKIFAYRGMLVMHRRIHTGDRPYQCDICKNNFTQKGHLVIHMRNHTGDRPYQCTSCKKNFTQSSGLKTHVLRMHSKNKPD